MNKIIVIGCPGSGKTTFAKRLAEITALPLYHLDAIWHKPDRTHISREEFDERIGEVLSTEKWIIDGNYRRTVEMRLRHADTAILFDLPTEVCLGGALARLGRKRDDIPWTESELDPQFRAEIERFRTDTLPTIYTLLDEYKDRVNVIIFKSREEADELLLGIQPQ